MPVSTEVWRTRVGKLIMPPSKFSQKLQDMWQGDISAPTAGVLIHCQVTLVVNQPCKQNINADHDFEMDDAKHSFIPSSRLDLLLAGDVETNPGPAPLLSEDDLQTLQSGDVLAEKPSPLLNKHIIQLNQLKKEYKSITWGDIILWLTQLMGEQATEFPSESAIQNQWNRLKMERQNLVKSRTKNPEKLEAWQEMPYALPLKIGPRGPRQRIASPNISDVQALQGANETLAKEVKLLASEKETLAKQSLSPHKFKAMARREKCHKQIIREQRKSLKKLSKKLEAKEKKLSTLRKRKRSLTLETDRLQKKIRKLEEPKPHDPEKGILKEQLETARNHIQQWREVNAELLRRLKKKKSNLVSLKNDTGRVCYSAEARSCIYQLLSLNIGFSNVGKAINAVLGLVGKTADHLPSARTVSNMNKERLQKSQKQMEESADEPSVTVASTDEAPAPPETPLD